jgi:hypothetical protein
MFGKRKAEDIGEESDNKQPKSDKKEGTEDSVKEEENGETVSPVSSANNDNKNGSQDGFASAGTCDRKDGRDVASSIHLYDFTVFWLQYLLKKLCLNTFFVIQFAGF